MKKTDMNSALRGLAAVAIFFIVGVAFRFVVSNAEKEAKDDPHTIP